MGMGMPDAWYRRQAIMLASQLPEDINDVKLVLRALQELVDTFLKDGAGDEPSRGNNVLPFVGS